MSSNENPFTPKDVKRRLIITVSVSFAFVLMACIAGITTDFNPFLTVLVAIVGGAGIAIGLWKNI